MPINCSKLFQCSCFRKGEVGGGFGEGLGPGGSRSQPGGSIHVLLWGHEGEDGARLSVQCGEQGLLLWTPRTL